MSTQQTSEPGPRILYVVACAAPPAADVHEFVSTILADGWDVYVIATPQATKFIDAARLEALTKHPVVSEYRLPSIDKTLPKPNAIIVAPATFNTINKWALGIADTYAVSVLCEYLRTAVPTVVMPYMKHELAQHPAFSKSVMLLKRFGVNVVKDDGRLFWSQAVSWDAIVRQLAGLPC